MKYYILIAIILPFLGTTLGSSLVFFLKNNLSKKTENILLGFSSGIMIAASIWSLLLPAIDKTNNIFLIVLGLLLGMIILILIGKTTFKKDNRLLLILSITIHNIPEGMAVGVICASLINGTSTIPMMLILSLGIAIQNIPEGTIISMPLKCSGKNKFISFIYGTLSGIVEPIASIITILLVNYIVPLMPILLSLAAGTMMYVVIQELIPESVTNSKDNTSSIFFFIGFIIMMILDVLLG